MKVINLGLPRTGTSSLAEALNILYPTKTTLHGVTLAQTITESDINSFNTFLNGNFENYKSYMDQYDFILDIPSIMFTNQTLNTYADATYIVTCRHAHEFAKSWSHYMKLSLSLIETDKYFDILKKSDPLFEKSMRMFHRCRNYKFPWCRYTLHDAIFDETVGEQFYIEHEKYVRRETMNKKNVLFFNVKEGWGPLCDFLGVDIPDVNFPFQNKLSQHRDGVNQFINSVN